MTETLGARIRRLREERRWSQKQLAELLAVTEKSVGNWENDRSSPRGSMGALRDLFGDALDAAGPVDSDPVIAAIDQSTLVEWRRDEVRSVYRRNVAQQAEDEGRRSG